MVSTIQKKHRKSVDLIVSALQAEPPRVRSALTELRRVFERSGENPPAILSACAALLNTDQAITADVLHAVSTAHAEWDSYGDRERELFHRCVYTSETRRAVAVTEVADVTAMLRENPPRISHALNGLRWLNAATQGQRRDAFTVCASLLKNPSATHPTIVDAIQTGYQLWPRLDDDHRALLTACIYASKERATIARRRAAKRQQQREAESGDVHRCDGCDGPMPETPELPYCSDPCRREAEAAQRPTPAEHTTATPAAPKQETTEQRARAPYTVGEVEAQYDEQYREIIHAIPSAGRVRKDERAVDAYEGQRKRQLDLDDTRDRETDLTGREVTIEDYERASLRGIDPRALCSACNLERTPTEQRGPNTDGRCEQCRERNAPPLRTTAPTRELAAVA
ncbi:hypothetical protein [Amycolatopsis anabasis]|uniref:hypothetical protein n=1 Tax=Amycolatopsis anabasis TaxID=1840409 RepID=UPI00131D4F86|nr:hypothetical protein [Amycolatopsis anabasis]